MSSKNKAVNFKFESGQSVVINALKHKGFVIGRADMGHVNGLEYKVAFYNEGHRHEVWFFGRELQSEEKTHA